MLINLYCSLLALVAWAFASPAGTLNCRSAVNPSQNGPAVDITSGLGGTYPRSNFLHDGSILAVYTAFSNGNNVLTLARSTDRGNSWSNIGTAASRPSATSDLDNPFVLQLPNGRIVMAYRNHDKDSNGKYTYYRITMSYSDDNGASWGYLSTPASDPAGPNGNWEPFMRNAQDGSLQLYYSRENAGDDQDTLMRTSTDGGKTWSLANTISGNGITSRDGMVGVASTGGSGLIAVFETVPPGGTFSVHSITSPDDGKTWGNRQTVYTPTGDRNNAGAPQVVNVGGTLVVSMMTDEDTQLHRWIDGAGAKLITSGNGGMSWGNKLEVYDPQANWPSMLTLDDHSFLYMADHSGCKSQKVVLS